MWVLGMLSLMASGLQAQRLHLGAAGRLSPPWPGRLAATADEAPRDDLGLATPNQLALHQQAMGMRPVPRPVAVPSPDHLSDQPLAAPLATVSNAFLPSYARENPSGYSYLCRLELKVEDTLPVGLWLKLGTDESLKTGPFSAANLRMKLFRF